MMIRLKDLLFEKNVKTVKITITPVLYNMFKAKISTYKHLLKTIGKLPEVGEEIEVNVNHFILGRLQKLIGKENIIEK